MRFRAIACSALLVAAAATDSPVTAMEQPPEQRPWGTMSAAELGIEGVTQAEIDLLMAYVETSERLRQGMAEARSAPPSAQREARLGALTAETSRCDQQAYRVARKLILGGLWDRDRARDIKLDVGAFAALQHVFDLDVVRLSLPKLRQLVADKRVPADFYATMYDRLAVFESRKQRYGTQFMCENGRLVLQPLEDPEAVDALREELGMTMPLADYAQQFLGRACGG